MVALDALVEAKNDEYEARIEEIKRKA